MNEKPSDIKRKLKIIEFIENRASQNETTSARHIHRRFDVPMEDAENILSQLESRKIIERFYDKEYQEDRYTTIK